MPPATPTLTVTPNSSAGRIELTIANTDSPAGLNDIYRSEGGASIRIADGVAVDGTFYDYMAASNVTYNYFARALDGSGVGADSVVQTGSLSLSECFIHAFTKTSPTSNASGNVVSGNNIGTTETELSRDGADHLLSGRTMAVIINSTIGEDRYTVLIRTTDTTKETDLETIFDSGLYVCVRDQHGNKTVGAMGQFAVEYLPSFTDLRVSIVRVGISEAV